MGSGFNTKLNFDCSKFLLHLLMEPNGKMCNKLLFRGLYNAAITGILNFYISNEFAEFCAVCCHLLSCHLLLCFLGLQTRTSSFMSALLTGLLPGLSLYTNATSLMDQLIHLVDGHFICGYLPRYKFPSYCNHRF
jgi:hypothetical protein